MTGGLVKTVSDSHGASTWPIDQLVTVVVLTHNRIEEVTKTLDRLVHLPERPPIIVVDNGSADGTAEILHTRFPHIDVVRLDRNVGASARNNGIQRARTPYVALCDDDTWWAPGSLAHATEILDAHPRVAVVTARVLVGPEEREDPTCRLMANSPLTAHCSLPGKPILGFLAGASVVRRDAFLRTGGFEPRFFIGGEEALVAVDLAAQGWAMAYVEELLVHHHPSGQRDAESRAALLLRNALWFAWMRRPAAAALRQTVSLLRSASRGGRILPVVIDSLLGLPWALRRRKVVPSHVEAALMLLEKDHSM
jgi:GT2 family glycosyltransferase